MQYPFENVRAFIHIGGDPSEFENLKIVRCLCIGFGGINKNNDGDLRGLIMATDVRHGKTACRKWDR